MDDEQVLRAAWPAEGAPEAIDDLLERHREPHRHYHTVAHVAWVLREVDHLASTHAVPDLVALHVAALFHDAVYDPTASDNEARSADLAVDACQRLGWSASRGAEVRRLILATAGHGADPDDVAAAVLLDADLSILGAPPDAYDRYAAAVRDEYAHVTDDRWRVGRAHVLQTFLERELIFLTSSMRAAREATARANLTREIGALASR